MQNHFFCYNTALFFLDKICLNYVRNDKQMPYFRKKVVTLRLDKYKSYR